MKKIAIFTDNLKVGGIQKSIVNMLNNINLKKYSIDLYLFDKETFYDIPKNINIIFLKRPTKILKFIPFLIVKRIYTPKINKEKYDVSIDFDSYQMHTAIGAIKCSSQNKAIWIHNDIPIKIKEEPKYHILHYFFKKKYQYFDTFCAVSKGALDSFKKIENYPNKRYLVIPNFIDTNEIKEKMLEDCDLKVDSKKINIVTVGRLCHQKGIDIMLANIKELSKTRQDFHLYIIGDGPQMKYLVKLTKEYKISQHITFLGNQKNPFKYLKKMDLFYLSSRYEGQGMVILEALCIGLDVLIPKHLEKYCPLVNGEEDIIEFLRRYKKKGKNEFNSLDNYNKSIIDSIESLFSNK